MSEAIEKSILEVLDGQDLSVPDIAAKARAPIGPVYSVLVGMESDGKVRRMKGPDDSTLWTRTLEPKQEEDENLSVHTRSLGKVGANEIEHPEKLSQEELEALVFAAIDAEYRTYGAIKRHAGLPWFDLETVISSMMLNLKIREETAGSVQAYFRYETKPRRCWLVGDGRVRAEFDESFVIRDEKAKSAELVASNTFNQAAALNRDWVGAGKPRKQTRGEITAADVRRAAATVGTKAGLAKALHKPATAVYYWLSTNSELQTAFEEGRAEWLENAKKQRESAKEAANSESDSSPGPKREPKPEKKKKRVGCPTIPVDPAELKKAASMSRSLSETAARLNIARNTLRRRMAESEELTKIYEENIRPGPPVRKATQTRSPKAVPAAETALIPAELVASPTRTNITKMRLTGIDLKLEFGKTDLVRFQGDLFSMSRRDRNFLNDIIDLLQRYGYGNGNVNGTVS